MSLRQIALTLFLCFGLTIFGLCQPQPQDPQSDPDVPITGLEYLLIGGGAYGVSRLLKLRKNMPENKR